MLIEYIIANAVIGGIATGIYFPPKYCAYYKSREDAEEKDDFNFFPLCGANMKEES